MAEMTVTISEPRPLKIAGSTVSRINVPITEMCIRDSILPHSQLLAVLQHIKIALRV